MWHAMEHTVLLMRDAARPPSFPTTCEDVNRLSRHGAEADGQEPKQKKKNFIPLYLSSLHTENPVSNKERAAK